MKDLEILNRASAFLIKANNKELNNIFEEKKSLTAKDKVIKYTPLKENKYHILMRVILIIQLNFEMKMVHSLLKQN